MAPKMKQVIECTLHFYRKFKFVDHTKIEKALIPHHTDWDKLEPDNELLIQAVQQLVDRLKELLVKIEKSEEEAMDYEESIKVENSKTERGSFPSSKKSPKISSEDQHEGRSIVQEQNSDLVQIERRINAFIERKQVELDDNNRREFCSVTSLTEAEDSCARTDAVFLPREGSKSHVRVTRVVNKYGPQTRPVGVSPGRMQHQPDLPSGGQLMQLQRKPFTGVPEAVDERLKNMESHLKLKTVTHTRDVYERLKTLEDRILQLESLSPEYFTVHGPPAPKRQSVNRCQQLISEKPYYAKYQAMSSSDIDRRIQEIKANLRNRQSYATSTTVKQEPQSDD